MRLVVIFFLVIILVHAPTQELFEDDGSCVLQYGDETLSIVPQDAENLAMYCPTGDVAYYYLSGDTDLEFDDCAYRPDLIVIDLNGHYLEIIEHPPSQIYVIGDGDIYVEGNNLDFQLVEDMNYYSPLVCFDYDYSTNKFNYPSLFNLGEGDHEFRDVDFTCSDDDFSALIMSAGELEIHESTFNSCENVNYGVQVNGNADIYENTFMFEEGTSVYVTDTGSANIYSNDFSTTGESSSYGVQSAGYISVFGNDFKNIGVAVKTGYDSTGDVTGNMIYNTKWGIDAQGYVEIHNNEITSQDLGIKYRGQVEVTENTITSKTAAIGYNNYDFVEVSDNTFVGEIIISKGVNFQSNDVTGNVSFNPYSGNISNNVFDIDYIDFLVDNLQDLCDIVYTDNEGPIVTPYECADWDDGICIDQLIYTWDSCEENETICYDGYDNDDNGLIDGDDPACALMACDVNGGSIWMQGQCVESVPEDVSFGSMKTYDEYYTGNFYADVLNWIHDMAYHADDCGVDYEIYVDLYASGILGHRVCVPGLE